MVMISPFSLFTESECEYLILPQSPARVEYIWLFSCSALGDIRSRIHCMGRVPCGSWPMRHSILIDESDRISRVNIEYRWPKAVFCYLNGLFVIKKTAGLGIVRLPIDSRLGTSAGSGLTRSIYYTTRLSTRNDGTGIGIGRYSRMRAASKNKYS